MPRGSNPTTDASRLIAGTLPAARIADNSVVSAKIAYTGSALATARPSGAGAGAGAEASVPALLDFVSVTRGAILYRGVSAWVALAPNTAGYVLTDGGVGADPAWAAGGGGAAAEGCTAVGGANQSIGAATFTAVSFNGEDYDQGGLHDNVTNNSRMTTATTGKVHISFALPLTAADATTVVSLYKNGAEFQRLAGSPTILAGGIEVLATAGDYWELFIYSTPGCTIYGTSGGYDRRFSYRRLAA